MALINGWYIQHPPWMQVDQRKNNAGEFTPGWEGVEATCRTVLELRMRLVPYLHAVFVRYRRTGRPPFRPLVLDYPKDTAAWPIDSQFLVGDSLLVAPVFAGQAARPVYLPEGEWFDFWTGHGLSGKQRIEVKPPLEQIPLFAKSGTILPLAQPSLHVEDPASWKLEAHVTPSRNHPLRGRWVLGAAADGVHSDLGCRQAHGQNISIA